MHDTRAFARHSQSFVVIAIAVFVARLQPIARLHSAGSCYSAVSVTFVYCVETAEVAMECE